MAEFLVKAVSHANPDPERDRRGAHKKGDIVQVMPDGHTWGSREGPPRFVVVRCPGVTVEDVRHRVNEWVYEVAVTVVSSNLATDSFRLRLSNLTASASGAARLTRAQVKAFLSLWNATFVSANAGAGTVTFDLRIADALASRGFWGELRPSDFGIQMAEVGYTQATGAHVWTFNYSLTPAWLAADTVRRARIEREVAGEITVRGGVVLSTTNGVTTAEFTRADVRERMRLFIEQRLGTHRRHRYHFTEAQVDTVLAQGGSITVTPAQLASAILDRVAE